MKRDLCKYNRPAKDIRSVIAPSPQETYIHIKRDLCVCKETYVYGTRTAKNNTSMIASSPPPPTPTFSRFHLRALDKRPTPEIYNRKQVSIHIYESCFLLQIFSHMYESQKNLIHMTKRNQSIHVYRSLFIYLCPYVCPRFPSALPDST